ncbi:MAG: hypothetical protein A2158_08035 [Chloroflexi bacterium RBG_13_46_14]|nr:MAG: hypothetical protein A2158_08035 [Chloroflexi bacterium RBG_13_46_14]
MSERKYEQNVIREPFKKVTQGLNGETVFTYDNRDNIGLTCEYHCINRSDWSINESRVRDGWELLCFLGSNPGNILDLGVTASICLGSENEEHTITGATVVSIPPGLKHGPVVLKEYAKPFVFLRISTTKEYEAKKAVNSQDMQLKTMKEGSPVANNGKKYWMNIIQGPFYKEREPGYMGTSISAIHNEYRSGTTLGYHCIYPGYSAPITHSHNHHELLCFVGGNPENVNDLGAEVSVCLGEEQEEHVFDTATIVSIPPNLKHCPVTVRNVSTPLVFLVICTAEEKIDIWQ